MLLLFRSVVEKAGVRQIDTLVSVVEIKGGIAGLAKLGGSRGN